jgi:hypothetical protein
MQLRFANQYNLKLLTNAGFGFHTYHRSISGRRLAALDHPHQFLNGCLRFCQIRYPLIGRSKTFRKTRQGYVGRNLVMRNQHVTPWFAAITNRMV